MKLKGRDGDYIIIAEVDDNGNWRVESIDVSTIEDPKKFRETLNKIRSLAEETSTASTERWSRIVPEIINLSNNHLEWCRREEVSCDIQCQERPDIVKEKIKSVGDVIDDDVFVIPSWD